MSPEEYSEAMRQLRVFPHGEEPAGFAHSFFIHLDSVRAKTPYSPNRASFSRQHYLGATDGQEAFRVEDG